MKSYWIPTGNWFIGTGYNHAHHLMQSFGMCEAESLESADLLVLPGGADIGVRPLRDREEGTALAYAKTQNIPVFGICRGLQFMMWSSGVTLIEHLPDQTTIIEHRTLTGDWTGQSGWHTTELGMLVNSRHHQGAAIAPCWNIIDRCSDGIIEAASLGNCFGVQWHPEHPEMLNMPANRWLKAELKMRDMI